MTYKKHPLILRTWLVILCIFILFTFISSEDPQSMNILIVIDLFLLYIIFQIRYQSVELLEDRIKYRKIKVFFPQTYEIPYKKVNDVAMSTYLPWFAVIEIKTWNNDNTKLSYFQNPSEIKEFIFQKTV